MRTTWRVTCKITIRLAKKGDAYDVCMVVVLGGFHVCVFGPFAWLWLGIPQMGTALSEVYPETSRATGSHPGQFHSDRSPVLGIRRRFRVDDNPHWGVLGARRALVVMRSHSKRDFGPRTLAKNGIIFQPKPR